MSHPQKTHQFHWRFGSWAVFWLLIDHHFCIRRTAHEVRTKTLLCAVCVFSNLTNFTFSFFSPLLLLLPQWQTSSSVVDSFFFLSGKVDQRKKTLNFAAKLVLTHQIMDVSMHRLMKLVLSIWIACEFMRTDVKLIRRVKSS